MKLKARILKFWHGWGKPLLVSALIVLPLKSSIADWNVVPTGSMKPTIVEGDRVFVNKLAYDLKIPFTTSHVLKWADPARGDIVVLFSPEDGLRLVKRVIGLPNDSIELRNNRLYINGQPSDYHMQTASAFPQMSGQETRDALFALEQTEGQEHPVMSFPSLPALRTFAKLTIPENCYFVMGDNRDQSKDSRFFGFVKRELIVGRATTVVMSLDPQNFHLPRSGRFFTALR